MSSQRACRAPSRAIPSPLPRCVGMPTVCCRHLAGDHAAAADARRRARRRRLVAATRPNPCTGTPPRPHALHIISCQPARAPAHQRPAATAFRHQTTRRPPARPPSPCLQVHKAASEADMAMLNNLLAASKAAQSQYAKFTQAQVGAGQRACTGGGGGKASPRACAQPPPHAAISPSSLTLTPSNQPPLSAHPACPPGGRDL